MAKQRSKSQQLVPDDARINGTVYAETAQEYGGSELAARAVLRWIQGGDGQLAMKLSDGQTIALVPEEAIDASSTVLTLKILKR